MTVGDLVHSDTHDICFEYGIYSGTWNDQGTLLFDSRESKHRHPMYWLLDEQVWYITIDTEKNRLIVEIGPGKYGPGGKDDAN